MKQCPVCKAAYADDSLSFCLNDGATLLSAADEQVTQVASIRSTNRTDFGTSAADAAPVFQNQPATPMPMPTRQSSKTAFLAAALVALLLLIVIGAVAAFLLVPRRDNGNSISGAATPTPKDDRQNEKIANLERQIQDLKKSPKPSAATPSASNSPAPLNPSGKATARVKPASDGFLAMRSAPNAETGYQILKIPSGATVELEDCQQSYQTIAGRRGRWCMVSFAGETGWAFDGWLDY